jgi:hypothetical protein
MDLPTWLAHNWELVSQNLLTLSIFAIVVAAVAVGITRAVMGAALEAARERLGGAQDDIARLKEEKSELLHRLQQHGEDIEKLKADLAALPRVHVSSRAPRPEEGKGGDLWAQVDNGATPAAAPTKARHDRSLYLSELEEQVLTRVAKGDGEPVPLVTVRRSLRTTNLRLEAAVERLGKLDLLEAFQDVYDEEDVTLRLSSRGRQYVIDEGLA